MIDRPFRVGPENRFHAGPAVACLMSARAMGSRAWIVGLRRHTESTRDPVPRTPMNRFNVHGGGHRKPTPPRAVQPIAVYPAQEKETGPKAQRAKNRGIATADRCQGTWADTLSILSIYPILSRNGNRRKKQFGSGRYPYGKSEFLSKEILDYNLRAVKIKLLGPRCFASAKRHCGNSENLFHDPPILSERPSHLHDPSRIDFASWPISLHGFSTLGLWIGR